MSYKLNQSNYSAICEKRPIKKDKKGIETNLMCLRRILQKKLEIGKIGHQRRLFVAVVATIFGLLEDWVVKIVRSCLGF